MNEFTDSVGEGAWRRGPIAWMTRHAVAANLLMAVLVLGGILMATRMKQEVFPEFTTDRISIDVPYPGASPEEVETGILLAIEDAVQGVDGVKEVTSNADEGRGSVAIELLTSAQPSKALQDVKNEIDRIQSFPEDAERPIVSLVEVRNQVLSVILHGEVDQGVLRGLAERARDELINRDDITLVEIDNARPVEISVEIPQETLRARGLTLEGVARTIRDGALELPGGGVRTGAGERLLRVQERRDLAEEFADIAVVAAQDGSRVLLGDIAELRDTFRETDQEANYDGRPAIKIDVFRVADQTPQDVSDAVKEWLEEARATYPEGVDLAIWQDQSEIYQERMDLLLRNAALGLGLVLLLLGLFLEARLAFWVTVGIVASVLGAFLVIPFTGASINMISLFAFIVTLGIIVDDAIIVGENIYEWRQEGMSYLKAAVLGAREIAAPVVFAVLTNIIAFMPLFFVPGSSGNLFRQIPAIVVAVFVISLVESLFILPAHLAHKPAQGAFWRIVNLPQKVFGRGLMWFVSRVFPRFIRLSIDNRYLTFAIAVGVLMLALGAVFGGRVKFSFLPRIDSDTVRVTARMPFGVAVDETRRVQDHLLAAAERAVARTGGRGVVRGIYTQIGSPIDVGSPGAPVSREIGSHLLGISLQLVPTSERSVSAQAVGEAWREEAGEIPGLETISFTAEAGVGQGRPIDVQLSHRDRRVLEGVAAELAESVGTFAGVRDVDDGVERGKLQYSYRINETGRALGLSAGDVARQVRSSFFGAEALRQQRGRNEVRVMVRLPENDRETMATVEGLILRTPSGGEIPLLEAVDVDRGYAYTTIRRRDGRRVNAVTADVDERVTTATEVKAAIDEEILPRLVARHPGLSYTFEGEQRQQSESLEAIAIGGVFALLAIFAMLAIPFRSYVQPLIVMLSIPFGAIGAVLGHVLLGYNLSIISMFGLIALAGVVVNDSMVLIVTANRYRDDGLSRREAVSRASERRFRPILLTSLTTFFGLAPMIFETSLQARFLIPMAISLGFGILFSTLIILIIVPAIYTILDDALRFLRLFGPNPKADDENEGSGASPSKA